MRAIRPVSPAQVRQVLVAQWPIVLVGLIFLSAFVLVGANFWRRGSLLIGVGAGVAAALRLVLPDEKAGLLVLRDRGLDFATMATAATVMLYVAATIDPLGTG
ncbi:DUF3017 domain-containing protein [Mycolicibacter acidiphilus]|uniref:DUF3017 domain-containing protein n=1 Tax=Mycolicibacter acidiphilus TaxID=2835306 RepID=UPI0027DC3A1A|nr:DUF3017 domain-containing protein [Mycolicibacter acidiphilus]